MERRNLDSGAALVSAKPLSRKTPTFAFVLECKSLACDDLAFPLTISSGWQGKGEERYGWEKPESGMTCAMKIKTRHPLRLLIMAGTALLLAGVSAADKEKKPSPPAPLVCNRVRFAPAPDHEKEMLGGQFCGSNTSPTDGFHMLTKIESAPPRGAWVDISFENKTPYRWLRYEAPAGSHGYIGELEFYAGEQKLEGIGYGSSVFLGPGAHWKAAFDGKPQIAFHSTLPDGQYVGLDVADVAAVARPDIFPRGGDLSGPQVVKMRCGTPGATIRYTLDGTTPGPQDGEVYTKPFTIEKNTTLVAVAFRDGLGPSRERIAMVWIGEPKRPPLHSFHVGNSLTANATSFSHFIRTAGGRDDFPAYLIGGSFTVRLWNESHGKDKARWDEAYAKAQHPLDYFTLQPRDFNLAEEADHATLFIDLIREKSPEVQPWLYAEWVEKERQRPTDKGETTSYEMKKTFPALTWEEAMSAMLLYNEEVQHEIAPRRHGGKPVRVLPTDIAFGWARHLVDEGKLPGVPPGEESFYQTFFKDHVHVGLNGAYLVALTWYGALCRESPEDKLLPIGTTLNAAQARVLQRLAWDVIQNYPDCGLYAEGTAPCAAPQIATHGKSITLSSATPGAWFRYTLDGTEPTRTRGYIYCGTISMQPGIQVKAIAYHSGMADSAVTAAAASATPAP